MSRCSAIVVTYNSAAAIGPCLEALTREDCEIIVVDNASQDETVQQVEEFVAWHPVRLIANEENRGFGAAVNQGAREAERRRVSHPQSRRDRRTRSGGCLAALHRRDSGQCGRGSAARRVTASLRAASPFAALPTLAPLLCEVLLMNQLWPGNPVNRRYRCLDADYSQQQEVEQPAGACLAVTRTAWESVGGFDEQFFPGMVRGRRSLQAPAAARFEDFLLPGRALPSQRRPQCGTAELSR